MLDSCKNKKITKSLPLDHQLLALIKEETNLKGKMLQEIGL